MGDVARCAEVASKSRSDAHASESAQIARSALESYGLSVAADRAVAPRDLLVDLLADVLHLCDESGWSFRAVVEEAEFKHERDRPQRL